MILHQRPQFRAGQFAARRHESAPLLQQKLRRAAIHHRNPAARAHRHVPCTSQLPNAAQHNAAELPRVSLHKSIERIERFFLAHGRQLQPHAVRHVPQAAFQRIRPEILRIPDQQIRRALHGVRLFPRADNRHARRIRRVGINQVIRRFFAPSFARECRNSCFRQLLASLAPQLIQRRHRHKRARGLHRQRPQRKRRVAELSQTAPRVLFAHGAALRGGNRVARDGDTAFAVGHGERKRLSGICNQRHIRRNRGNGKASRPLELLFAGQAVDLVTRLGADVGPQAHDGDLPRLGVMPGINQFGIPLRGTDLQAVAVIEIAFQSDARHIARCELHPADFHAAVADARRVNHARVLRAHSVPAHKAAAGENLPQSGHFGFVRLAEMPIVHRVDGIAVAVGNRRDVFRAFEPPLQLDGRNTRLVQLRQVVAHTHIARREPRRGLAAVGIQQAARLSAAPAVAASSADDGGEQALPADSNALRAMPEHFDFDALFRGEGDFGGAAFAGKHRAGHALIAAEANASRVVNRHLRAGVNGQIREAAPRHPQHAQILHQHRIHADFTQQPQHIHDSRHLAVLNQRIDSHMDTHMMQMGEPHGVPQLLHIEIARACPRRIRGIPQIHRVRARRHRTPERIPISRRCKILHPTYSLL